MMFQTRRKNVCSQLQFLSQLNIYTYTEERVFTITEGMIFAKDTGPVTGGYSWTDAATGKRYPAQFLLRIYLLFFYNIHIFVGA
jgi:hypothetical protein